ncbi:PIN-like domain-containing protein [Kitasatospora sp. HPMI-4]|uniref:PIN-like domain-containing protein n=1 Tax=Kitasatospora sp. HPMI-4 TaxID=3448443 RepID=UPI003F1A0C2A
MREQFSEYYSPSDEEYLKYLSNGVISLDTNVLLAPYRMDNQARGQLFSILEALAEQIWIPHQAAWEFFNNRPNVLAGEDKVYQKLETPLTAAKKQLEDHIKTLRGHSIVTTEKQQKIIRGLDDLIEEVRSLSNQRDSKLEEALRVDPVLNRWELLLSGKVGERPDVARHAELDTLAKERIKSGLPPGGKDADKGVNANGDAVLWLQLIDHAKEAHRPVLLVTDDTKEDWYRRQSGQTIGPRTELVREMRSTAGVAYYQQPLSGFLRRAGKVLSKPVSEETIKQTKHHSIHAAAAHYESIVVSEILSLHEQGLAPMVQRLEADDGIDLIVTVDSTTFAVVINYHKHAFSTAAAMRAISSLPRQLYALPIVISNAPLTIQPSELIAEWRGPRHQNPQWIHWDPSTMSSAAFRLSFLAALQEATAGRLNSKWT